MRLAEIAIFTNDVDRTAEFYQKLLGVMPVHRGSGIAIFEAAGVEFLIHEQYTPGPGELPCENHVAFAVPDVE